ARARHAELDLVAMTQHALALHALAVDVRPVQAPQVAQHELTARALLDDAVLLGRDLVHELDGISGVPAEAVRGAELDGAFSRRCTEDQTWHLVISILRQILPTTHAPIYCGLLRVRRRARREDSRVARTIPHTGTVRYGAVPPGSATRLGIRARMALVF